MRGDINSMFKIFFECGKCKPSYNEMRLIQAQFFASTGIMLTFEGWLTDRVAQFKLYSHFL